MWIGRCSESHESKLTDDTGSTDVSEELKTETGIQAMFSNTQVYSKMRKLDSIINDFSGRQFTLSELPWISGRSYKGSNAEEIYPLWV